MYDFMINKKQKRWISHEFIFHQRVAYRDRRESTSSAVVEWGLQGLQRLDDRGSNRLIEACGGGTLRLRTEMIYYFIDWLIDEQTSDLTATSMAFDILEIVKITNKAATIFNMNDGIFYFFFQFDDEWMFALKKFNGFWWKWSRISEYGWIWMLQKENDSSTIDARFKKCLKNCNSWINET